MRLPFGLEWLPRKAPRPPVDWAGPAAFSWDRFDVDRVSRAMRARSGQPDSEEFRDVARVVLDTMRGGSAVELVARAVEAHCNPGLDPERPITGSHYMRGMPCWCMWVEYARPAVEAVVQLRDPPCP